MTATAPADQLALAARRVPATPVHAVARRGRVEVSSASVEVVRIVYGLIGAVTALRFLTRGWVDALHLAPAHHLTYPGFDWVAPLPAPWAHLHLVVVALAGLAVALGYRTRLSLGVFLVGFVWIELIDAALYLNHYWLVTLLGVLLLALPVGRRWALDTANRRVPATTTVPAWAVWAVRAQLAAVYMFAGIGKLNADWLLHGEPLSMWIATRSDRPFIGPFLDAPGIGLLMSWMGAVFDLTIVGWLCWRRSRPYAYAALVAFHLMTAMFFQIGLFPWMMIALVPVFFAPDWPTRCLARVTGRASVPARTAPARVGTAGKLTIVALLAVNVVVPLRHFVAAGDVRWNDAGYYGSFRVMLTEKTGWVMFHLTDADTGARWTVDPHDVFEDWQVSELSARRDLLVTAAHIVAADARAEGHAHVEVHADAWVSFNGRARQRFVGPDLDLAAIARIPR
jgi:hypothetical protein